MLTHDRKRRDGQLHRAAGSKLERLGVLDRGRRSEMQSHPQRGDACEADILQEDA